MSGISPVIQISSGVHAVDGVGRDQGQCRSMAICDFRNQSPPMGAQPLRRSILVVTAVWSLNSSTKTRHLAPNFGYSSFVRSSKSYVLRNARLILRRVEDATPTLGVQSIFDCDLLPVVEPPCRAGGAADPLLTQQTRAKLTRRRIAHYGNRIEHAAGALSPFSMSATTRARRSLRKFSPSMFISGCPGEPPF